MYTQSKITYKGIRLIIQKMFIADVQHLSRDNNNKRSLAHDSKRQFFVQKFDLVQEIIFATFLNFRAKKGRQIEFLV